MSLPTNNQPSHKRLRTKPSETESYRLLKAYLRIQSPDGQIISGLFALDTHSNVTYIREQYSLARTPHPHENAFIHGAHTTRANRNFRSLRVLRHGHIFKLDARAPDTHVFSKDPEVIGLLSAQAIATLGISLDYASLHLEHKDALYLDISAPYSVCLNAILKTRQHTDDAVPQEIKDELLAQLGPQYTTHLSNQLVRKYIDAHPDEFKPKPLSLDDLQTGKNIPPEYAVRFRQLSSKYASVAYSNTADRIARCRDPAASGGAE